MAVTGIDLVKKFKLKCRRLLVWFCFIHSLILIVLQKASKSNTVILRFVRV